MGEKIVEELNKGNVEKASAIFSGHGIQHDDFDIDGIVVTRKDLVQTNVLAEDEVAEKMHNDIENFLQSNTQEEE